MMRDELERVLDDVAAAMPAEAPPVAPPIERTDAEGGRSWSRGGVSFAILGDAGVELRLDPRVAAAAARTPDAAPSGRGPDWVRFNPRILDPHAVDRLEAWFGFAARRAADSRGRGDGGS